MTYTINRDGTVTDPVGCVAGRVCIADDGSQYVVICSAKDAPILTITYEGED